MITDPRSKNYGNEIKLKGVQFPSQVHLIKLIGAANLHVAHNSSKISQEHQIRMRSHECKKVTAKLQQKEQPLKCVILRNRNFI